jgi:uncharacterized repeat protein (TIGR01451 family)
MVDATGTAMATLTLSAGFPISGSPYSISATYSDSSGNFGGASGTGTLTVTTEPTTLQLPGTAPVRTFNSTNSQSVSLSAQLTSNSGAVDRGSVTFTVPLPGGGTLTAGPAPVGGGTATATLTVPAGLAVGSYTIMAAYADGSNNFGGSSASTTLTINPAGTNALVVTAVTAPFTLAEQKVNLSAQVSSPDGGTVNEGTVTFTVGSLDPVTGTVDSTGKATATVTLPAAMPDTAYTITAAYSDTAAGPANFNASSGTGLLTVDLKPNVVVSQTGPSTVTPGNPITYAVTVSNHGTSDAQGVTVTDQLPTQLTEVTVTPMTNPDGFTAKVSPSGDSVTFTASGMPAGSSDVFQVAGVVARNQTNNSTLASTASGTTRGDTNPGDNSSTANVTVKHPPQDVEFFFIIENQGVAIAGVYDFNKLQITEMSVALVQGLSEPFQFLIPVNLLSNSIGGALPAAVSGAAAAAGIAAFNPATDQSGTLAVTLGSGGEGSATLTVGALNGKPVMLLISDDGTSATIIGQLGSATAVLTVKARKDSMGDMTGDDDVTLAISGQGGVLKRSASATFHQQLPSLTGS